MSNPVLKVRAGETYQFGVDYSAYIAKSDRIDEATSVVLVSKTPGGAPDLTIGTPEVSTTLNGIAVSVTVDSGAAEGDTHNLLAKAGSPLGSNIAVPFTFEVIA